MGWINIHVGAKKHSRRRQLQLPKQDQRISSHFSLHTAVFSASLNLTVASALSIEGVGRLTGELEEKAAGKKVVVVVVGGGAAVKIEGSFLCKARERARGWPSQVNRLWAVSHSWQTHNYSISSTINGNALKTARGDKADTLSSLVQLVRLHSFTHHPLYPLASRSLHSVIPIQHSI